MDPDIELRMASQSQGGVPETLYKVGGGVGGLGGCYQVCCVCGEEFCYGDCALFDYSHSSRCYCLSMFAPASAPNLRPTSAPNLRPTSAHFIMQ